MKEAKKKQGDKYNGSGQVSKSMGWIEGVRWRVDSASASRSKSG